MLEMQLSEKSIQQTTFPHKKSAETMVNVNMTFMS